jgi:hypothetical protein
LKFVAVPPDQVAKFVADLDSDQFAVRQKAVEALDEMGLAAESAASKILAGNLSLEQRQRLEQFLDRCRKETLRQLRVVETLDQIGTAQARQLLEAIAKGTPSPQVGQFAAAVLERYARAVGR